MIVEFEFPIKVAVDTKQPEFDTIRTLVNGKPAVLRSAIAITVPVKAKTVEHAVSRFLEIFNKLFEEKRTCETCRFHNEEIDESQETK